ncbi:GH18345 [Drosophila grimshawi]|uniref:Odorant receptor n=1 Tax=Drosophila grimshawi TaxID=7222 RepID=B4JF10_DROGR|nr:GH18345 [Drosophila grimshawi]
MLNFLHRLHKTHSLLDSLDERLQSDSDREKVHKGVAFSNRIFLGFGTIFLVYLVSDFIADMANGQPSCLVYNPIFDSRNGCFHMWLQTLIEKIQLLLLSVVLLILDTYPIIILNIVLTHVDILKDHIRNLRSDPLKTEADNYDDLVSCVSDYVDPQVSLPHIGNNSCAMNLFIFTSCCEMIRPIVECTIFVQFLLIGAVLGEALINVLYFSDGFRAISPIGFAAGVLVETFPFCYFCDLLAEDATDLANILGQSNWIDADRKYKSSLHIFMIQIQKPIIFIAGGLFPVSLNSNIKDHIRHLRTDPLKTEADNYDDLVSCISDYESIRNCCEMIRPIVECTIFVQFLLIGAVLGEALINVLYFSDGFRAISPIGFVAAVLVETFPFCYFCDLLAEDATDLANILGQSNWIDADRKYKSSLHIFMIQIQKPIIFIAGGLFPISLNTNIKMAKFAFSVMTLVQRMNLTDWLN